MNALKPPKGLRRRGRELFRIVTSNFPLEDHHLPLLRTAAEALDRYEQCRARLDREGLVVRDRFGQQKSHPLLAAERDARAQFLSALNQMGLDEGALPSGVAGETRAGGLRALPGGKRG